MRVRILLIAFLLASPAAGQFKSFKDLPTKTEIDPLVSADGTKVTTAADWQAKRKPELKRLFELYMYGRMPAAVPITSKVLHEDKAAFGGKATLKEVQISFGPPDCPKLNLLLVVPNDRRVPAPVFVGLNFNGNHAVVADPKVAVPTTWLKKDVGRGKEIDNWSIEQTIDRGYAVATAYCGDIDPDSATIRTGVSNHLWKKKFTPPEDDDPATIITWAWGLGRMLDYLMTDPMVDAKRAAVVGHSRLGKATMVAGAFDERFALVIPHQSGTGGAAPNRSKSDKSESVTRITKSFPHWFVPAYAEFGADTSKLPVDQNCLIALCAPRPVLLTNAADDLWANPSGQFEMLKAAEPVYKLLNAGGCDAATMPEVGKLVDSTLGYGYRAGKHSMAKEDWKMFCDYADKRMK